MANINDVFPSRYLKAHDLKGTSPTVTIARVSMERVQSPEGVKTKPVLYFTGKTKGLILNKTMALSLKQIAQSALTEQWPGKAITLYATTATFGKEVHDVIRIKAPTPVQTGVSPQPPRRPMPPIFTDDLEIDLADAGVRR